MSKKKTVKSIVNSDPSQFVKFEYDEVYRLPKHILGSDAWLFTTGENWALSVPACLDGTKMFRSHVIKGSGWRTLTKALEDSLIGVPEEGGDTDYTVE